MRRPGARRGVAEPMTPRRPASLGLYRLASTAASVLAGAWLRDRVRRGKEDPARWRERLGHAGRSRPGGDLVWLHGVSVGESLSLLPLVGRLLTESPETAILVTSGTRVSADILATRLRQPVLHQFAPLDTPGAARRFLDHWRPKVGVFVESELWPNLLLEAKGREIRLALVSAKLSDRSLAGWRRAPEAARTLLGAFDLILARDVAAAERFEALGAKVDGLADLKFGAAPLPVDEGQLAEARENLGDRPVLLAASTHPGEEELILRAFRVARGDDQRPLLIIAPRHPDRGEAVESLVLAAGFTVGRRGAGSGLGGEAVYVADTVGELGLWFRLASLAVVGGSLTIDSVGGHNPLEPARLGCPLIAGADTHGWPVYDALEAAAATARVAPDDLAGWFARTIRSDPSLAGMAERARAFVETGDAVARMATDRVLALVTA